MCAYVFVFCILSYFNCLIIYLWVGTCWVLEQQGTTINVSLCMPPNLSVMANLYTELSGGLYPKNMYKLKEFH